jgi:hypothetical protein
LDFQEQSIPEKQKAPIPYYISLLYHRVEKLLDDQDCLILVSTLQANLQRQSGACVGRFQHAAGFVSEITCKSQRGRITLPGLNAQQTRTRFVHNPRCGMSANRTSIDGRPWTPKFTARLLRSSNISAPGTNIPSSRGIMLPSKISLLAVTSTSPPVNRRIGADSPPSNLSSWSRRDPL